MSLFASFTQTKVTQVREASKAYFAVGWQPLPIVAGGKHPTMKNWGTDLVSSETDIEARFKPGDGVGVALGAASSKLGDIDFDHTLAASAGALLVEAGAFPDGLTFGRKSMPASHRLFCGDGPIKAQKYSLPQKIADQIGIANEKAERGGVLFVEVRGDGAQTVFPPSRHASGETRLWENITELPDVTVAEACRFAGLSAFLAVIMHCYGNAPSRNDLCLALTGLLIRCGFDVATADGIVLAIAKECQDEEASKRLTGARASQRLESGKAVSGLHAVCDLLGLLDAKKIFARWLFGETPAPDGDDDAPSDGRPQIVLSPGKRREAALEAINALKNARVELFLRAGQLVRVGRNETTQKRRRILIEIDALRAGLGILERELPAIQEDLIPTQRQHLVETRASERQEPDLIVRFGPALRHRRIFPNDLPAQSTSFVMLHALRRAIAGSGRLGCGQDQSRLWSARVTSDFLSPVATNKHGKIIHLGARHAANVAVRKQQSNTCAIDIDFHGIILSRITRATWRSTRGCVGRSEVLISHVHLHAPIA